MNRIRHIEALLLRSRRLPWAVWMAVLLVLGGVIVLMARPVRTGTRQQLIHREGEILYPLVVDELDSVIQDGLFEDPKDTNTHWAALLSLRRIKGMASGLRLFGPDGRCVGSFPALVQEDLAPEDLQGVEQFEPVSRFDSSADLSRYFVMSTNGEPTVVQPVPLLVISVPLHVSDTRDLLGVAQFIYPGSKLADEFQSLDRRLLRQGLATFLVAGFLVTVAMVWAFRHLHRLHLQLAARTESLLEANAELALAARTTALGAITSHLVHGLRSPLAGLQNLVRAGRQEADGPGPEDWEQAAAAMRRMQALITEVVQVLREYPDSERYRVSFEELTDQVRLRLGSLARERGVELHIQSPPRAWLDNRVANLVKLIILNLAQNGLEATRKGGRVQLSVSRRDDGLLVRVTDQGEGIPESLKARLFKPVASNKEGGSGLGLAISRQLALHLNANLELNQSDSRGSVFELRIPAGLVRDEERRAESDNVSQAVPAGQL